MDEEIEDVKCEMRSKQGEIKEAKSEVVTSEDVVQRIQEKIDLEMSETEKLSVSYVFMYICTVHATYTVEPLYYKPLNSRNLYNKGTILCPSVVL